ncbi:MAG: heavy-metal-associated domain-containing protein [Bacteroidales bacterium]|nr:heavy-metal-associated domain-containing protein [Bacteroidales bacterium]
MKSKLFLVSLLMLALSFSTFAQEKKEAAKKNPQLVATSTAPVTESKFKEVVFKSNLHCQTCVDKVQKELPYMVKGLKEVTCNLESNTIKVVYNSEKVAPETIKKSIIDLGYKADDPNAKPAGCSKSCPGKCSGAQQQKNCSGHKH